MEKPVNSPLADLRSGVSHLPSLLALLESDWGKGCRVRSLALHLHSLAVQPSKVRSCPGFAQRSAYSSRQSLVLCTLHSSGLSSEVDLGGKTEPPKEEAESWDGIPLQPGRFLTSDPELRGSTSQSLTFSMCKEDFDLSCLP